MKRVIVHLGLRKTATTAIQYMLDESREALKPGIRTAARDPRFETWRQHVYRFMTAKPEQAADLRQRMIDGIDQETQELRGWIEAVPEETLLISDENLFASRVYANGETIFDWAEAVLPIVEQHWSIFDLRFVMYTRQEAKWLRSCHNQEVKNNRLAKDYSSWSSEIPEGFNLKRNMSSLAAKLLSPLTSVSLEDELQSDLPIGHTLLRMAGVTDQKILELPEPLFLNESLPPAALEFMLAVNRLQIPDASKPAIGGLASTMRHLFADDIAEL